MSELREARYRQFGGPDVIEVVQQEGRTPGPGEVAVRMKTSGINPLDVKRRSGAQGALVPADGILPHTDGAGIVDSVGSGVERWEPGQRVWIWGVGQEIGTATDLAIVPADRLSPLPERASFELGASLGIPAITAALCLSRYGDRPIDPTAQPFAGKYILIRGAGAVAHFSIQLAKLMGAYVAVSASEPKLASAKKAGADFAVDRRGGNTHRELGEFSPDGYDLVVDVSPAVNMASNVELCGPRATIALYGREGGDSAEVEFRELQAKNITIRSIRTVDLPTSELGLGASIVTDALKSIGVGDSCGFPLSIFSLDDIGKAHELVESGSFHGKALIAL